MSADIALPQKVFAHGWWTNEGEKISKSLGNVIVPDHLISVYGLDSTRYFLMREVPFGSDGNFSRTAMVNRINSDLANTIGNLVQRTLSMIHKNCDATIPSIEKPSSASGVAALEKAREHIDAQEFHLLLELIVNKARNANEKIDKEAPWSLRKEGTDESLAKMNRILYELAEEIRHIALLLQPFTPKSAAAILTQLGVPHNARNFAAMATPLAGGTVIEKPEGVFPRFQVDLEEKAS
jgi:methionyl-tRNA synthetase